MQTQWQIQPESVALHHLQLDPVWHCESYVNSWSPLLLPQQRLPTQNSRQVPANLRLATTLVLPAFLLIAH